MWTSWRACDARAIGWGTALHKNAEDLSQVQDSVPLVSIAMPIFNAGRYLRPAVLSVMQQTFADWELIIIDDGSSDGAAEGILDLGDSRIRIVRDGFNRGLAARLNEAIDQARGRFFARMDQDDISYPDRLATQLRILERDPEIDLCGVRCVAIDADDQLVGAMPYALNHEALCAKPWSGFYLPHPTWVGRMEWFRHHRYASPGPFFCEDQELLLRSYRSSHFAVTPEILFAYRVRDRINWGKSIRTRKTLLGLQLRHFFFVRQYLFCFLAAVAFAGRIAMDSLNAIARVLGTQGLYRHSAVAIEPDEVLRWHETSNQLALAGRRLE